MHPILTVKTSKAADTKLSAWDVHGFAAMRQNTVDVFAIGVMIATSIRFGLQYFIVLNRYPTRPRRVVFHGSNSEREWSYDEPDCRENYSV